MALEYREITKEVLEEYRELILPMVYKELEEQDDINSEYICIATWLDGEPVGALISELEGSGDINLLSIWTAQEYRQLGIASALLDKMLEVASELYDWEEGQYGDDVVLKTMYCLKDKYRAIFEEWLKANDFTDFLITHDTQDDTPQICSATAEVHFYRS